MLRSRFIAFCAVSIAVLVGGCAQYSEAAVAARMELSTLNAEGIARATATLAAKADELHRAEVDKADAATIQSVLLAVEDGMTSDTITRLYIQDVNLTRAALDASRADWLVLIDEFNAAAENQRIQGRMTAAELEAARKINLLNKGGNK